MTCPRSHSYQRCHDKISTNEYTWNSCSATPMSRFTHKTVAKEKKIFRKKTQQLLCQYFAFGGLSPATAQIQDAPGIRFSEWPQWAFAFSWGALWHVKMTSLEGWLLLCCRTALPAHVLDISDDISHSDSRCHTN